VKLVVASMNPHKARELAQLLAGPGLELVSLATFPNAAAPDETGETLLDNARIKADAACRATGLPAIADDTGLEVDALGGRPGVHTARYAGPDADPARNVARLLEELADVPAARRGARFRTVCLLRYPDGRTLVGEGVLEGRIAERPRGAEGFGYDPVFEVPELGRTLAELDASRKNALSHRGRAARTLRRLLDGQGAGSGNET
jgi:XTP/dITP diphosphohydrolase